MADYFDRLLARSVPGFPPAGPVVRPRLLQVFEPAGAQRDQEEPVTASTPAPPGVMGTPGPAGTRGPAGETPHVAPPPIPAVPPGPEPATPELVPVHTTTTVVTAEHTRHELVREPVVEQRLTSVNISVSQGDPVAELRPRHVTVVAPAPVTEPRHTPVPARHRAEKPQPQAVHVAIGRVEVTAMSTEPAQARRAKAKRPEPVLSLERYLAREDDRR